MRAPRSEISTSLASLAGAVACWIFLSWNEDDETTLPAGEVAEAEHLVRFLSVGRA